MKHTEKHFADEAIKHHLYLLNLKDTVIIDPEKYILLLQPLIKARCSMEEQHMDATDIGSLIVFRLEALSAGRYMMNPYYWWAFTLMFLLDLKR